MRILNTELGHRFDRITGLHPMPQKGTERRRSSERVTSSDKSALLWMYGREIASFETPTFSRKVGEIIAGPARREAVVHGIIGSLPGFKRDVLSLRSHRPGLKVTDEA
jgi:hypothetical protein